MSDHTGWCSAEMSHSSKAAAHAFPLTVINVVCFLCLLDSLTWKRMNGRLWCSRCCGGCLAFIQWMAVPIVHSPICEWKCFRVGVRFTLCTCTSAVCASGISSILNRFSPDLIHPRERASNSLPFWIRSWWLTRTLTIYGNHLLIRTAISILLRILCDFSFWAFDDVL